MTSISKAASATVLVIGPVCESTAIALGGKIGTRPYDGFRPKTPLKDAGMRIDPPASVPRASGPRPHATAAAAPPDDPPEVRSRHHAFLVTPSSGESVTPFQPNSKSSSCP